MPDFYMKEGDYFPSMSATLADANGAIDLSVITSVYFAFRPADFTGVTRRAAATVTDGAGGRVQYDFTAADVAALVVGNWIGEWQIEYNAAEWLTVPNDKYIEFTVLEDLKT